MLLIRYSPYDDLAVVLTPPSLTLCIKVLFNHVLTTHVQYGEIAHKKNRELRSRLYKKRAARIVSKHYGSHETSVTKLIKD